MIELESIENRMHFASDNNSGVLPEILAAIPLINNGHMDAYGRDPITKLATKEIKRCFGEDVKSYFVFNGTAANVAALSSICKSYEAIICSEHSHIHWDECGAPEVMGRTKLLLCPSKDGKLSIDEIKKKLIRKGDPHCVQAKVVSVTQPTELGTLYSLKELKAIGDFCKEHGLFFHMDGSRLANAAAALDCSLKAITKDIGLDLLSFGGTKNGLMLGEAVVFFNPSIGKDFLFYRKQFLQLAGKMRFISIGFYVWLKNDLWLKYAKQENQMALDLAEKIQTHFKITQKTSVNSVFAIIPKEHLKRIRKKFFFYVWNENTNECRLMTSFDTKPSDIEEFEKCILEK
ncbi:MAG: low specificity L-threonine aldolase [Bdellovibrionales bacterium]